MTLNAPHVHLLINHVPLFAFLFGAAALAWGWRRHGRDFQIAGASLCLVGALATQAAFMTGERSEETVETLPGVTDAILEEHEEAAEWARPIALAAGALALVVLFLAWRSRPEARPLAGVLALAGLLAFAVLARVALLGGEVRHTEIRAGAATAPPE